MYRGRSPNVSRLQPHAPQLWPVYAGAASDAPPRRRAPLAVDPAAAEGAGAAGTAAGAAAAGGGGGRWRGARCGESEGGEFKLKI